MLRDRELSQLVLAFVPLFTKQKQLCLKMTKRPVPTFYVGVLFVFDKNGYGLR